MTARKLNGVRGIVLGTSKTGRSLLAWELIEGGNLERCNYRQAVLDLEAGRALLLLDQRGPVPS
jgi:hypothetical protein